MNFSSIPTLITVSNILS